MKAYVIERAGGPDVLQLSDIAVLEPGADEVQIRVGAFGLNRAEVYRRLGKVGADDVRRAHSLIESDRALGKFVVRV